MAKSGRGTARQSFRYTDEKWQEFGEAVVAAGAEDRTKVLAALIDWYMRTPGAKLPPRPVAGWSSPAAEEASA